MLIIMWWWCWLFMVLIMVLIMRLVMMLIMAHDYPSSYRPVVDLIRIPISLHLSYSYTTVELFTSPKTTQLGPSHWEQNRIQHINNKMKSIHMGALQLEFGNAQLCHAILQSSSINPKNLSLCHWPSSEPLKETVKQGPEDSVCTATEGPTRLTTLFWATTSLQGRNCHYYFPFPFVNSQSLPEWVQF